MKKMLENVGAAMLVFAGVLVAGCAVSPGEPSSAQEGALAVPVRCPNTQPANVDPCTGKNVGDQCTAPNGDKGTCQKYVPDEPADWCLCAFPPPNTPPNGPPAEVQAE